MSKSLKIAVCAICFALIATGSRIVLAGSPATQPSTQPAATPVNTKCPVSGDDIDPTKTVVYNGKTIAFCCEDCIKAFNKDPEKYVAKMK